jgi:hypothetical protein
LVSVVVAASLAGGSAHAEGLTMPEAVAIALQRNRDVIAAKLEIEGAQLDVVAARIYPNPQFSYALGNLVLGVANPQNAGLPPPPPPVTSGFLGQPVQSFGVSEPSTSGRSGRRIGPPTSGRPPALPDRGRAARHRPWRARPSTTSCASSGGQLATRFPIAMPRRSGCPRRGFER